MLQLVPAQLPVGTLPGQDVRRSLLARLDIGPQVLQLRIELRGHRLHECLLLIVQGGGHYISGRLEQLQTVNVPSNFSWQV